MGVLYDAGTEYHRSASAAVVTLTHTATIANVQGVVVSFIRGGTTAPTISNVSYGGVSLVRVANAADAAGEPGNSELWSTTSPVGLLSGVRSVIYSTGAPASNVHVTIMTFTGRHPAYAIGSGTKAADTTSWSVSLTTGYVSGYAIGAFYGGGAEPATLTYGTDRTLVHDWDMGAFYGEVFRTTSPTAAGTGPVLGFGGNFNTAVSDDVAFSALFLTDGAIEPGVGAVTVAGLVPIVEGHVFPEVGLVNLAGLVPEYPVEPLNTHEPTLWTELKQNVGLGGVATVGQVPGKLGDAPCAPGVGAAVTEGRQPSLLLERLITPTVGGCAISGQAPGELRDGACGPGLGGVAALGLIPGLSRELQRTVGVGLAQTAGHAPTLTGERVIQAGLGAATIGGLSPSALADNQVGPPTGLAAALGLAPSLYLERIILPGIGESVLEGRAPAVSGDGEVLGTATPGAAIVTLQGLGLTLSGTSAEEPRGHAIIKRRRHRRNYGELKDELSDGPQSVLAVPAVALEPPEIVEPAREAIAALDTSQAEGRLTKLETRRSRLARMRREEEELIAILMRAA